MSVYICGDGYIAMSHEALSRSDINTGLTQIRTVCMTQTVRNEIIRKRKRRHESIPIYLASHRDIHIAPQMSTQTIIRRFRVLIILFSLISFIALPSFRCCGVFLFL